MRLTDERRDAQKVGTVLYFTLIGAIAEVDETTPDNPLHPSPVLLVETDEKIERVVLP